MTENIIDVAIVGGGVSGVYTGWRLLTSDLSESELSQFADESGKLNVQVFELSDRIGGTFDLARSTRNEWYQSRVWRDALSHQSTIGFWFDRHA